MQGQMTQELTGQQGVGSSGDRGRSTVCSRASNLLIRVRAIMPTYSDTHCALRIYVIKRTSSLSIQFQGN